MSLQFGKAGKSAKGKSFIARAGEVPDPLADVEYTGSVEVDAAAEVSALESAFKSRRVAEDRRFRNATDSEFWFAVYFQSRAEKESFLRAIGALRLGDKYIDGAALAKVLGLDIERGEEVDHNA